MAPTIISRAENAKQLDAFKTFLVDTGRDHLRDKAKKTPDCLGIYEHFSAINLTNPQEAIPQLYKINKQMEPYRNHSLHCQDCRDILDARFLFPEFNKKISIFPEEMKRILAWERGYGHDEDRNLRIVQKPAPPVFGGHSSKLVYLTGNSLIDGIEEFDSRIRDPLELDTLSAFSKPKLRNFNDRPGAYWSTDANSKGKLGDTHIRLVSADK